MERWFAYESGMSWCESQSDNKYKIVPFVAEFANTVSNLPLVLFPLLNVFQLWPYLSRVNPLAIWPHALLALNGMASAYYHATLSLFGQLMDELLLLHMINTCLIAYMPVLDRVVPPKLQAYHRHIRLAIVLLSVMVSVLCFIKPAVNAFVLITFSLPAAFLVYFEGTRNGIPEAPHLINRIMLSWTMAITCWLADRLICELWLQLGTPYLHAVWHFLAAYAGYNVFVMFSLLDIKKRSAIKQHGFSTSIRYFPSLQGLPKDGPPFLTFPYLVLMDSSAKCLE
ncbi:hypothetical protein GPALN_004957 [Globodera pallida]|nr:hypothetical protein GPALN_004957 [Globodera pallida]